MVYKVKLVEWLNQELEVSVLEDPGDRLTSAEVLSYITEMSLMEASCWTLLDSHSQPRQLFWSFSGFFRAKDENAPQAVRSKGTPTTVLQQGRVF